MENKSQVQQDNNLFVKKDGEWSKPIFGNSGNKLIANEKKYENGQQVYIPYLDSFTPSEAKPVSEPVAQAPTKPVLSSKGRDWRASALQRPEP